MARISIITPLHNKGPYIVETLTSVQAQTFVDWEMIVVENHSSDDGPEQVSRIAEQDGRIRLLHAPDSVRGPGAARNLGFDQTQGDWVLFLDADDLLHPNYLWTMLNRGLDNPEAVVIASPWVEFNNGCNPTDGIIKQPAINAENGLQTSDTAIAITCWAIHAAIVRRSWLKNRTWPEELDGYLAEDTAFWFRVVCGASIAYSNLPGAYYRTHIKNSRTNFSARPWYEGNHRAVLANLDYIKSQGITLSRMQMEMLM